MFLSQLEEALRQKGYSYDEQAEHGYLVVYAVKHGKSPVKIGTKDILLNAGLTVEHFKEHNPAYKRL